MKLKDVARLPSNDKIDPNAGSNANTSFNGGNLIAGAASGNMTLNSMPENMLNESKEEGNHSKMMNFSLLDD